MARYIDYSKIPMGKNDIGAKTIGEYFEKLLLTLWDEQEDFSGKRPFGNGGWEYDVYASLISAGVVDGSLDEEGYVSNVAYSDANDIVCEMIKQIFASDADVVPKSEVEKIEAEVERLRKILDSYALQYGTVMDKYIVIERVREDVASEIFAEIESKKMFLKDCVGNMGVVVLFKDISELKKKYTEETK